MEIFQRYTRAGRPTLPVPSPFLSEKHLQSNSQNKTFNHFKLSNIMTQEVKTELLAKVASTLENVGIDANAERRGMPLQANQTLHPIVTGADDIHTQTIPAGNGQPERTFLYVDTQEGVRLTPTQITRRGSGIKFNAATIAGAFTEWIERVADSKKYSLTVENMFSRPGNNGNMQHSAVFRETIEN